MNNNSHYDNNDSDNDIDNLNNIVDPSVLKETEDDQGVQKGTYPKNQIQSNGFLSHNGTDIKTQHANTATQIKSLFIVLCVYLGCIILNLSLGIYIWKGKGSFFARIFTSINIASLLVVIFTLVSGYVFRKKFLDFHTTKAVATTEIDILEEGEAYENLQKSTESSLMNGSLYGFMFLILINFIFSIASFAFNSQTITEVNSYANSVSMWKSIYSNYSYTKILTFLSAFIIFFGIFSLIALALSCYLFYLLFSILGFFNIYQKILQFISLLYLQLGIVFLYLSISMQWYAKLSLIEKDYPLWLPTSLGVASLIVITLAISGYVGATKKSKYVLISTSIFTALFIAMFTVFSFCSVITMKSLNKFNDNKCPTLIDYYDMDYIYKTLKCEKYTETSEVLSELNCPKERIVTAWEVTKNIALSSHEKKYNYGCIDMSCCYNTYNLVQSFHNYIAIISFCLIIFGVVFIGGSLYMTTLIQNNYSIGVDEKASGYFVSLFVGVITVLFIILLAKMHLPNFSPSFVIKFKEIPEKDTKENNDGLYNSFGVIKNNKQLYDDFQEKERENMIYDNYGNEDYSECEGVACEKLQYEAHIESEVNNGYINNDLVNSNGYTFSYATEGNNTTNYKKLVVYGDVSGSHNLFTLIYFHGKRVNSNQTCEGDSLKTRIKFLGKSRQTGTSFIELKQVNSVVTDVSGIIYKFKGSGDIKIQGINMKMIQANKNYVFFDKDYDFSSAEENKTQVIKGRVVEFDSESKAYKPVINRKIKFEYLNFPHCAHVTTSSDVNGDFTAGPFKILKNYVKNELKLLIENNDLIPMILIGGIGYSGVLNIGSIALQNDISDDNPVSYVPYRLSARIINSITLEPIEGADVAVYEGSEYFPNVYYNNSSFDYDNLNNENGFGHFTSSKTGLANVEDLVNEVYTVLITKEGFFKEVIHLKMNAFSDIFYLTPLLDEAQKEYRIVLTWPRGPKDLNGFAFFKSSSKAQCEVFFGNKQCQSLIVNNENYNLGTQGVQVMTIAPFGDYVYTLAVNRFVENNDPVKRREIKAPGAENFAPKPKFSEFQRNDEMISDVEIGESQAQVKIYTQNYSKEIYSGDISGRNNPDESGGWWYLFCMKGKDGIASIKTLNYLERDKPSYKVCEDYYKRDT